MKHWLSLAMALSAAKTNLAAPYPNALALPEAMPEPIALAMPDALPNPIAIADPEPIADPLAQPSWLSDKWNSLKSTVKGAATSVKKVIWAVPDEAVAQLSRNFDRYNNIDRADHRNWMASYLDDTLISQMSIPGTHDTMTYNWYVTPIAQCQSYDLATQFRGGIRYIDIRARHWKDQFEIFHSVMPTLHGMTFVIEEVKKFLDANPTETIILRHKKENADTDCTRSYLDTYNWYRYEKPETKDIYARYAWKPKDPSNKQIPALGELRGKFLVMYDFDVADPNTDIGLKWSGAGSITEIQDAYDVATSDNKDIDTKWTNIEQSLELARSDKEKKDKFYFSHLSGASINVWPRPLALGTVDYVGMNIRAMNKLKSYRDSGDKTPVGVIIMDYPGEEITGVIVDLSNKKR